MFWRKNVLHISDKIIAGQVYHSNGFTSWTASWILNGEFSEEFENITDARQRLEALCIQWETNAGITELCQQIDGLVHTLGAICYTAQKKQVLISTHTMKNFNPAEWTLDTRINPATMNRTISLVKKGT